MAKGDFVTPLPQYIYQWQSNEQLFTQHCLSMALDNAPLTTVALVNGCELSHWRAWFKDTVYQANPSGLVPCDGCDDQS